MAEAEEEVRALIRELRTRIEEAEAFIARAREAGVDVSAEEAELYELRRKYELWRDIFGE